MKQKEKEFLQVITDNQQRIYRICSVYAKHEADKKDLIQEVFLNLWKSFSSFEGKAHINSWVYRIALNVCLRASYSQDKNNHITLETVHLEQISTSPNLKNEQYERLYQCIATLESFDKSIIVLYLEDLAYKDIASIVGISENYVAVKIKRIKAQLKNCIKISQ